MYIDKQSEMYDWKYSINLHSNEYSQELHYSPFAVKLDRCVGSWNTLNILPYKLCVPNETEYINLRVFNMITRINKSKIILCKCKCKFDGKKCNSDQWWNNDKCWCKCKNIMDVKENLFRILLYVAVKMENI